MYSNPVDAAVKAMVWDKTVKKRELSFRIVFLVYYYTYFSVIIVY